MAFKLDFIGVGAARCGTTWISSTLSQHPSIYMPVKELHYFNRENRYSDDLCILKKYYVNSNTSQKLGEFTPRYAITPVAINRINKHFPDIKIILVCGNQYQEPISSICLFIRIKEKKNLNLDLSVWKKN